MLSRRQLLPALLAAGTAPPLKITKLETVYWKSREDAPFWPHWTWLKIHTDAGVTGIGDAPHANDGNFHRLMAFVHHPHG